MNIVNLFFPVYPHDISMISQPGHPTIVPEASPEATLREVPQCDEWLRVHMSLGLP